MPAVRALASLSLLVVACSSSSSAPAPGANATPERVAFSYATNLIPAEITIGGATGTAYIDTGNPFVLVDPATFTSAASLPPNGGNIPTMSIGSQAASNVYAVATTDGLASPDPAFPIVANVGCTGICGFVAALNYREVTFTLGSALPTPPLGLEPETVFDFSFEGGSVLDGVTVPRSRIVVTVTLEGADYSMILDSGASLVTVNQAAYDTLTKDGRTQLMGATVETTAGQSTSSMARAASIVVGGVKLDSVVVAHDSSFDANLAAVATDVGHAIDGSLGGTYLHDFYVTIDYPKKKIHLARYTNIDFALDPAERIGLELEQDGSGGYIVAVATGDAATKGVSPGDVIVAIDGVNVAELEVAQAGVLIYGAVGSTKTVSFGAAVTNANRGVPLVVEEFLPLPTGK